MTVPFTGVPEQAHRVEVSASVQSENKYTTVNVSDLENESSAAISLARGGLTYDVRVRYIIVDANGTHLPSAYVRTTHAVPALASTIGTNVTTAIANAASAQSTADGKIDSFYQNEAPSSASEGDIWFDTNDGNKIYTRRSGAWVATQDSAIATALQDAADADAKADGKVTTFYQSSAPTAEGTGDLWVDTDDGNKLYRWSGSAWVSVQDTSIATAITNAASAQSTADGKIDSFYQNEAPSSASEGDIWFDTNDGNKIYTRRSGAWVATQDSAIATALQDAADADAKADGKVTTFYQSSAPTAEGTGDLWVDTDDGNKLYRWSGSAWVGLFKIRL